MLATATNKLVEFEISFSTFSDIPPPFLKLKKFFGFLYELVITLEGIVLLFVNESLNLEIANRQRYSGAPHFKYSIIAFLSSSGTISEGGILAPAILPTLTNILALDSSILA